MAAEILEVHTQFEERDIVETARDIQWRLKWNIGSECSVYSRSSNEWISGEIVSLEVDTTKNAEWMIVRYGANKRKQIQRFSTAIRPKEVRNEYVLNLKLYQLITDRLRERRAIKDEEGIFGVENENAL